MGVKIDSFCLAYVHAYSFRLMSYRIQQRVLMALFLENACKYIVVRSVMHKNEGISA